MSQGKKNWPLYEQDNDYPKKPNRIRSTKKHTSNSYRTPVYHGRNHPNRHYSRNNKSPQFGSQNRFMNQGTYQDKYHWHSLNNSTSLIENEFRPSRTYASNHKWKITRRRTHPSNKSDNIRHAKEFDVKAMYHSHERSNHQPIQTSSQHSSSHNLRKGIRRIAGRKSSTDKENRRNKVISKNTEKNPPKTNSKNDLQYVIDPDSSQVNESSPSNYTCKWNLVFPESKEECSSKKKQSQTKKSKTTDEIPAPVTAALFSTEHKSDNFNGDEKMEDNTVSNERFREPLKAESPCEKANPYLTLSQTLSPFSLKIGSNTSSEKDFETKDEVLPDIFKEEVKNSKLSEKETSSTSLDVEKSTLFPSQSEITFNKPALTSEQPKVFCTQSKVISNQVKITSQIEESSQTVIEPSQQTIEPSQQTIEPSQQTIEPSQQTIESSQQTIEPSQQIIEPSQQETEPSQQTIESSQQTIEPSQHTIEPSQQTIDSSRVEETSQEMETSKQPFIHMEEINNSMCSQLEDFSGLPCGQKTINHSPEKQNKDYEMLMDLASQTSFIPSTTSTVEEPHQPVLHPTNNLPSNEAFDDEENATQKQLRMEEQVLSCEDPFSLTLSQKESCAPCASTQLRRNLISCEREEALKENGYLFNSLPIFGSAFFFQPSRNTNLPSDSEKEDLTTNSVIESISPNVEVSKKCLSPENSDDSDESSCTNSSSDTDEENDNIEFHQCFEKLSSIPSFQNIDSTPISSAQTDAPFTSTQYTQRPKKLPIPQVSPFRLGNEEENDAAASESSYGIDNFPFASTQYSQSVKKLPVPQVSPLSCFRNISIPPELLSPNPSTQLTVVKNKQFLNDTYCGSESNCPTDYFSLGTQCSLSQAAPSCAKIDDKRNEIPLVLRDPNINHSATSPTHSAIISDKCRQHSPSSKQNDNNITKDNLSDEAEVFEKNLKTILKKVERLLRKNREDYIHRKVNADVHVKLENIVDGNIVNSAQYKFPLSKALRQNATSNVISITVQTTPECNPKTSHATKKAKHQSLKRSKITPEEKKCKCITRDDSAEECIGLDAAMLPLNPSLMTENWWDAYLPVASANIETLETNGKGKTASYSPINELENKNYFGILEQNFSIPNLDNETSYVQENPKTNEESSQNSKISFVNLLGELHDLGSKLATLTSAPYVLETPTMLPEIVKEAKTMRKTYKSLYKDIKCKVADSEDSYMGVNLLKLDRLGAMLKAFNSSCKSPMSALPDISRYAKVIKKRVKNMKKEIERNCDGEEKPQSEKNEGETDSWVSVVDENYSSEPTKKVSKKRNRGGLNDKKISSTSPDGVQEEEHNSTSSKSTGKIKKHKQRDEIEPEYAESLPNLVAGQDSGWKVNKKIKKRKSDGPQCPKNTTSSDNEKEHRNKPTKKYKTRERGNSLGNSPTNLKTSNHNNFLEKSLQNSLVTTTPYLPKKKKDRSLIEIKIKNPAINGNNLQVPLSKFYKTKKNRTPPYSFKRVKSKQGRRKLLQNNNFHYLDDNPSVICNNT